MSQTTLVIENNFQIQLFQFPYKEKVPKKPARHKIQKYNLVTLVFSVSASLITPLLIHKTFNLKLENVQMKGLPSKSPQTWTHCSQQTLVFAFEQHWSLAPSIPVTTKSKELVQQYNTTKTIFTVKGLFLRSQWIFY